MFKKLNSMSKFSRKNKLYLNVKAELTIHDAMVEVECLGADIRLTEVISLLSKAKSLLADYIDEKLKEDMS